MIPRLAWRSIWRNRRRTLITIISIGFGLAFAIFFLAMGEGVYNQLIDQVARTQAGHITLENPAYRQAPAVDLWIQVPDGLRARIQALPQVDKTKLLILGQGMASSGSGSVGVALMGVEPSVELKTSPLARNLVAGRYLADGDKAKVMVGRELAKRLRLDIGKKLVVTTNDASGQLVEQLLRVAGIFETGSPEFDSYFIQTTIGFARRLYGLPAGGVTQLGVVLKQADDQQVVLPMIQEMVAGQQIAVRPWQEVVPELSSYVRLDRASNQIFQALLIFLVLFTIFNTILMSVLERSREFAVLLAIGTKPSLLRLQILMESVYLGLIGCLLGVLVGGAGALWLQICGLDLSNFYSEGVTVSGFAVDPVMRASLTPGLVIRITALVYGSTLLLTLLPMRRAGKVSIVDQLR